MSPEAWAVLRPTGLVSSSPVDGDPADGREHALLLGVDEAAVTALMTPHMTSQGGTTTAMTVVPTAADDFADSVTAAAAAAAAAGATGGKGGGRRRRSGTVTIDPNGATPAAGAGAEAGPGSRSGSAPGLVLRRKPSFRGGGIGAAPVFVDKRSPLKHFRLCQRYSILLQRLYRI
jgi:hypothetical protein